MVFCGLLVAGLYLRRFAYRALEIWIARVKWEEGRLLVGTRRAFLWLIILIALYVGVLVSPIPADLKSIVGKTVGSLSVLIVTWVVTTVIEGLFRAYLGETTVLEPPRGAIEIITRLILTTVGALIILDIWGAPTTPIILLIAAAVFVGGLALRDTVANLVSAAQIVRSGMAKTGDFIKLKSGESGYVAEVTWRHTKIRTLEGDSVLIPNVEMVRTPVTSFGHGIKQAKQPFRFYTHLHIKELTGLKASNLQELSRILKDVPDSVIFFHTHHFLEEHSYLIPELTSDFALWVTDVLGNEALGERLASIDTFDFPSLEALKARLVGVIDEYLASVPDGRKAAEGEEFHFVRSRSVVLPTPYVANNLREFVEMLRKVTVYSVYFHVFEAKLRLRRASNDFCAWVEDSLEEPDLAAELGRLDYYSYRLEALRSKIIEVIEKYIG